MIKQISFIAYFMNLIPQLQQINFENTLEKIPSREGPETGPRVSNSILPGFTAIIFLLFFLTALLPPNASAQSLTAKQILQKIDENFRADTQVSVSTMIIHSRRATRTIRAKTYARGRKDAFTEYLSPAREKGTKMLKLDEQLWIYSPSADRIIKISGHMLRQSLMGSDLSYEDFMTSDRLQDDYRASITGRDTVQGRPCWLLELTAKRKEVAYFSQKIRVDKTRFLVLQADRFAKSGKLLKSTRVDEVFKVDGRWYPKRIVFKDMLKAGKGTEIVIEQVEFNKKIPAYLFSKAALKR